MCTGQTVMTNIRSMNLKLKRPIIFFDLETTGVDAANDRIVEISMVKIDVNGEKQIKTRRINPERPIPAEATAVHGITDDDGTIQFDHNDQKNQQGGGKHGFFVRF